MPRLNSSLRSYIIVMNESEEWLILNYCLFYLEGTL